MDLWHAVALEMGVEFELKEYSGMKPLLDAVSQGKVDVIPAVGVSADREIDLDFSIPYYQSGSAIAVSSENVGFRWLALTEHFVQLNLLNGIGLLFLLWFIAGMIVWLFERHQNPEMFGGDSGRGIGHAVW